MRGERRRGRRVAGFVPDGLCALGLIAMALVPARASAQSCPTSYLNADWSDTENPTGLWSYRAGGAALPSVESWQRDLGGWTRPQPGWAESESENNRLPFWYRSNGYETFAVDYRRCDVVVHTQDDGNGVGNGNAALVWTAPVDSAVWIRGNLWMARDIDRGNAWSLYRNDELLSEGAIASGDPYSRDSPFRLEDGSGGAGAVDEVMVQAGDEIRLVLTRTTTVGDFVGVRMRVGCVAPDSGTTTTTLYFPDCGDAVYVEGNAGPSTPLSASDALHVLNSAVGVSSCDLCVCDVNGSGAITAGDALAVLIAAVGTPVALVCPFCPC